MELARLLTQLDDSLLGDLFSASALTRARAYVGRVRNLEVSGNQLQALVQGSDAALGALLVLGSAVVTNLRFLGALFPERPSTDVTAASTRMLLVGLALSAASGALMFVPRAAGAAATPCWPGS